MTTTWTMTQCTCGRSRCTRAFSARRRSRRRRASTSACSSRTRWAPRHATCARPSRSSSSRARLRASRSSRSASRNSGRTPTVPPPSFGQRSSCATVTPQQTCSQASLTSTRPCSSPIGGRPTWSGTSTRPFQVNTCSTLRPRRATWRHSQCSSPPRRTRRTSVSRRRRQARPGASLGATLVREGPVQGEPRLRARRPRLAAGAGELPLAEARGAAVLCPSTRGRWITSSAGARPTGATCTPRHTTSHRQPTSCPQATCSSQTQARTTPPACAASSSTVGARTRAAHLSTPLRLQGTPTSSPGSSMLVLKWRPCLPPCAPRSTWHAPVAGPMPLSPSSLLAQTRTAPRRASRRPLPFSASGLRQTPRERLLCAQ
mmetsp:Transcript_2905/g.8417  ORF Transcript_2905/g.8417 Transcript_2905/m.8417 type:complete len:374 (+) Transcript_2905:1422-2543(+)